MSALAHVFESPRDLQETMVHLRKAVEAAKWGILGSFDFGEILASKGFPQGEEYKSLQICAPGHAAEMIANEPLVALCMPCNVLAFTQCGKTFVATMKPLEVLPAMFGGHPGVVQAAEKVDVEISAILRAAIA